LIVTTVRESRIARADIALRKSGLQAYMADWQIEGAATAVVDALFTDHSMDHLTVPSVVEREDAEYLPGHHNMIGRD
jgi:hypothetical protein